MIYKFERVNDKWLELRQRYITATDFASLMNLNSYTNVEKMIQSKITRDKIDNKFLRDGKIMEPAVIQAVKEDLGWDVGMLLEGASVVFTDEDMMISSTPDAFRWDEPAVLECKVVNEMTFNRHWRAGTPPMRYIIQVYIQMLTTGMRTGYLAAITAKPNIPLVVYKVDYSPELTEHIKETAKIYWENHQTAVDIIKKRASYNYRVVLPVIRDTVSLVGIYEYPEEAKINFNGTTKLTVEELFGS